MLAVPAAALAVLLGFALNAEIRYRRRAEAIRVLQEVGDVTFGRAPPPSWFSKLLGRKAQADLPVYSVLLAGPGSPTEAALPHVAWIRELEGLSLARSAVTDAGLAHLRGLTELQMLELPRTGVTDAGLAHLGALTGLRILNLEGTGVTDAGLVHLCGLTNLHILSLTHTRVTDTGLAQLCNLTKLNHLYVADTCVTATGVATLRKRLPGTRIYWP
jgi:hypothetical protein